MRCSAGEMRISHRAQAQFSSRSFEQSHWAKPIEEEEALLRMCKTIHRL